MQDRKEYILQKSFEVFLAKGYDSASMTVLHQALKISRGAMYRYFESKEELFRAVIDRYFFGLIAFVHPEVKEAVTVAELIDIHYQNVKKICKHLDKIEEIETVFLNYTALIIQAAKHYPGFIDRMKKYKSGELKKWQQAIERSIERGEIRKDINTRMMAQIFAKAVDMNEDSTPQRTFSQVAEETKKVMLYIYALIKP